MNQWARSGLFLLLIASSALAAPSLTFSVAGVEAIGITPGGDAIWLAASKEPFNGALRLWNKVEVTSDADGDGRVRLDLDVKRLAVWVVVDYATGAYAIARPDGLPVRELIDRGDKWAGGATYLDFLSADAHVLLVRSKKGAWIARAFQGTPADADGRPDGNLRVKLEKLTHIHGDKKSPPDALPNDLLIVIDTDSLDVFVRRAREQHE